MPRQENAEWSAERQRLFELLRERHQPSARSAYRDALLGAGEPWCSDRQCAVFVHTDVPRGIASDALDALAQAFPGLRDEVSPGTPALCPSRPPELLDAADARTPFRAGEPLTRWAWSPQGLLLVCHELAADRYAVQHVLLPAWAAACGGEAPERAPVAAGVVLEREYWSAELLGARSVLPEPVTDAEPTRHPLGSVPEQVLRRGRRSGATPATTLLAVWTAALASWSGRQDVTVAVCSRNRMPAAAMRDPGPRQTVLPVRVRLTGADAEHVLAATASATRSAYAHPGAPPETGAPLPSFGLLEPPPALSIREATARVTEVDATLPPGTVSLEVHGRNASIWFDRRALDIDDLAEIFLTTLEQWTGEPT